MEILSALEQKIESLVGLIKRQKEELSCLTLENQELKSRVSQLETALLNETTKSEQELKNERSCARQAVDDLIKNIDALIDGGVQ